MVQKITWLPIAQSTFADAINYLEHNFSRKEILKFSDKVQHILALIQSNPHLGRPCKKANIYKTVINKRVILFYRLRPVKKEIELLAFWNTWQDHKKLNW